MTEYLDTFDENMNPVGVESRDIVHRLGLWHRTFQCWIVKKIQDEPHLLLQKRHRLKDTNPEKLDASCAGHLSSGETVEDGVRELREELGLTVPFAELTPIAVLREQSTSAKGADREFCHLFLYECGLSLQQYKPQLDEVSGLYFVSLSDMEQLLQSKKTSAAAKGFAYSEDGNAEASVVTVGVHELVLKTDAYYESLFQAVRRDFPVS